jgi:prepilin-type N-terminal cleavage/methylation domain-containing protein
MNRYRAKSGFTLVELLVVISIIATLSTIALAALNEARSKAEDAKRVMEVHSVDTAIKQFQLDKNTVPGNYNNNGTYNSSGGGNLPAQEGTQAYDASMNELVNAKFLPSIPKSSDSQSYKYYDFGGSEGQGATFWAKLGTGDVSVVREVNSPISRNVQTLEDVKTLAAAIKKAKTPGDYIISDWGSNPCVMPGSGTCWVSGSKHGNQAMYDALLNYLPNIPVPLVTDSRSYLYGAYYASTYTKDNGTKSADYIYFEQENVPGEPPIQSSQSFWPSGSYPSSCDTARAGEAIRAYIIGGTGVVTNDFVDGNFMVCHYY